MRVPETVIEGVTQSDGERVLERVIEEATDRGVEFKET